MDTTYVHINGISIQNLKQDFEVLGDTISSCLAGDPVTMRSVLNGHSGDIIQNRKKYDGCLRDLEKLRHVSRDNEGLFNWLLDVMKKYIIQLQNDRQQYTNGLNYNENLKTLSKYFEESKLLKLLTNILFEHLSYNGSRENTFKINKKRSKALFDVLAETNSIWLLQWALDNNILFEFKCQVLMEFTIWKLSQLNSNIPFTIFDFLIDVDAIAYQQCILGLLDIYLRIAQDYMNNVNNEHNTLSERVGKEEQIWSILTVKNLQTLCYFEYITKFSLCITSSGVVTSISEVFYNWLRTWLLTNTNSVIPHVLPICISLDSLANEKYVVCGSNIKLDAVQYLSDVITTECVSLIQQVTNAFDECIVDICSNASSHSHLAEVIVRNFMPQNYANNLSPLKTYKIIHAQLGTLYIMPDTEINLNQTLNLFLHRLETNWEPFWLTILKCIGLSSKQAAEKTIQGIFSLINLKQPDDQKKITRRINILFEFISLFERHWENVFSSLIVDKLIKSTLIREEADSETISNNIQSMNVYKTLLYFIFTDSKISNIQLSELIGGSLKSSFKKKLIYNAENARTWLCKPKETKKYLTNLELLVDRPPPKFRYNTNKKSYSSTWHSFNSFNSNINHSEKSNSLTRLSSNSLKKDFLLYLNDSIQSSSINLIKSNILSNGRIFRLSCMGPDSLSCDFGKTNKLSRILINKLTTLEPPTSVIEHMIVPKPIPYERDCPELRLLVDFLANDHVAFRELHDNLSRSLLSINISFWYRALEHSSRKYSTELDMAIGLIETMRKASYVPPPLNYIGRLLPHVFSKDVGYLLYEIIWKFVLENWQLCPYSEEFDIDKIENNLPIGLSERIQKLKLILQKNILSMPELLSAHFV
ncbi:115_t:CDS:10 [Diversispora eburnea]|uniref:115_t:CDS:1 n=1 Tax=Diversispora eburnea TaxID=1213867 RepID=A0A9N8VRI4_9GLOM|nr:115_t:CDS:10 [Diversispora eburnea]